VKILPENGDCSRGISCRKIPGKPERAGPEKYVMVLYMGKPIETYIAGERIY